MWNYCAGSVILPPKLSQNVFSLQMQNANAKMCCLFTQNRYSSGTGDEINLKVLNIFKCIWT